MRCASATIYSSVSAPERLRLRSPRQSGRRSGGVQTGGDLFDRFAVRDADAADLPLLLVLFRNPSGDGEGEVLIPDHLAGLAFRSSSMTASASRASPSSSACSGEA